MKNKYELVLLTKIGADTKDIDKLLEEIKISIKDGGKILKDEDLGKRKLAYPIVKEFEANYRVFLLEADGASIKPLAAKLKMSQVVVRHLLTVKKDPKKVKPDYVKKI
jgi:small subunit ribosomal protein S6